MKSSEELQETANKKISLHLLTWIHKCTAKCAIYCGEYYALRTI